MLIKSISIRNFRSIQSQTLSVNSLNVLVGNNDIGKSNFLKALNLFFNQETDVGTPFNFKNDFCSFAVTPRKKAPEILVEITFSTPPSFNESRDVIWRKTWRSDGLFLNRKFYSDGKDLEGRKKIGFWLEQIKYSYVPAIKGQEYFTRLLGDLHNVLSNTIEEELKIASEGFIGKIRTHTQSISNELVSRLGLISSLQIPPDLSVLFKVLDFETSSEQRFVSLKYRGDGIKVRHIPVILKFISEQRNINKTKGAIKSNDIWGYEEPENNLELTKAFDHAHELIDYCKHIQIFLTTHSPAFYSIKTLDEKKVKTFIVRSSGETKSSIINEFDSQDLATLDSEMGLLPFVSPHIKSLIEEKTNLLEKIQATEKILADLNSATLFVEGASDKRIIKKAISVLDSDLEGKFSIKDGNGANSVADMTIAWFFNRKQARAVALFDWDVAGKEASKRINDSVSEKNRNFRFRKIPKVPHLQTIFRKGINLTFSIEELFTADVWAHAEKMDWLEFKTELIADHLRDPSRGFNEYCMEVLQLSKDEFRYLFKVKDINKEDFCDYVAKLNGTEATHAFSPFKYLLANIKEDFGLNPDSRGDKITFLDVPEY